jgi:uncharacterized protein
MFPTLEPLTINHKTLIEDFLKRFPPQISELTFTNLFIWRRYYQFRIAVHRGFLTLLAHPPESAPFFLSPSGAGDLKSWGIDGRDFLTDHGFPSSFARLSKSVFTELSAIPGLKGFPDRDNSDYVYLTRNLTGLSGNRYHGLKNHINQFVKMQTWEYLPLTPALVGQCLDLEEAWCQLRQCPASPGLLNEEEAIIEALTHFEVLDFKGGVIRVAGKIQAFTFGEALNPETVVIHVEKANPEFPGLYPLIQQQFLEGEWKEFPYVNREQDLGLEGLRKAKLSYHPEFMIDKYKVVQE